jgi:hypothetical protein
MLCWKYSVKRIERLDGTPEVLSGAEEKLW